MKRAAILVNRYSHVSRNAVSTDCLGLCCHLHCSFRPVNYPSHQLVRSRCLRSGAPCRPPTRTAGERRCQHCDLCSRFSGGVRLRSSAKHPGGHLRGPANQPHREKLRLRPLRFLRDSRDSGDGGNKRFETKVLMRRCDEALGIYRKESRVVRELHFDFDCVTEQIL